VPCVYKCTTADLTLALFKDQEHGIQRFFVHYQAPVPQQQPYSWDAPQPRPDLPVSLYHYFGFPDRLMVCLRWFGVDSPEVSTVFTTSRVLLWANFRKRRRTSNRRPRVIEWPTFPDYPSPRFTPVVPCSGRRTQQGHLPALTYLISWRPRAAVEMG